MQSSNIRTLVTSMDDELKALASLDMSAESRVAVMGLGKTWSLVVEDLALAPEPKRACPKCGKLGMAEAKVCGYCWAKRDPL